ncbi:MAG TPA: hypothetical protein VNP96_10835 [Solirubrobacterales bacterium]|nr:hypothetical protein [Solirubrobacterales bacterium]
MEETLRKDGYLGAAAVVEAVSGGNLQPWLLEALFGYAGRDRATEPPCGRASSAMDIAVPVAWKASPKTGASNDPGFTGSASCRIVQLIRPRLTAAPAALSRAERKSNESPIASRVTLAGRQVARVYQSSEHGH